MAATPESPAAGQEGDTAKVVARDLSVFYGEKQALFDVALAIAENRVTSLIGPSGCGKSTFLRCINRMNDTIDELPRSTGRHPGIDAREHLRRARSIRRAAARSSVGMVFQKPNPFPKSIYENVAYGPRIHGLAAQQVRAGRNRCDTRLKKAGLFWNEVKDRLADSAGTGHQLAVSSSACALRARLPSSPEVILMDEPCSALDPIATAKVEELIHELRENFTIVIVTHSMQQAARVSQRTAMFHLGNLVEENDTDKMFTNPDDQRTQDYIMGRFG